MEYIVRVVGYNAFWTGDKTPGKLWSTDIEEAKKFTKELDAINVIYTGRNMEVVAYHIAKEDIQPQPPNWHQLDEEAENLRKMNEEQGFKTIESEGLVIEPDEFVEVSEGQ